MSGLEALLHHGHEKRVQVARFFGKDEDAVRNAAALLQEEQVESHSLPSSFGLPFSTSKAGQQADTSE